MVATFLSCRVGAESARGSHFGQGRAGRRQYERSDAEVSSGATTVGGCDEGGAVPGDRRAERGDDRRARSADGGQGPGGDRREGLRGQLPRRADGQGDVPGTPAAAVRARAGGGRGD